MSPGESEIRLLMVDDEVEFLQAMTPGLTRRGFAVTTVEDGHRALGLLASEAFDVVLLDVKMPGLDGVEVFRAVKERYPGVPVVLLTGHGNLQQAFETSREGVQDYLTKPCEVETLATVLREAVARAAAREKAAAESGHPNTEAIELLLVDDDQEFVQSVAPALRRRGMNLVAAGDAAEALQIVRQRRAQVAVVDVVMPGMDGLTLLERMREADPLLEVVILTGNPSLSDVRRGLMDGAFDYLIKPCRMEELAKVIRAARERRRAREAEERRSTEERILADRPD